MVSNVQTPYFHWNIHLQWFRHDLCLYQKVVTWDTETTKPGPGHQQFTKIDAMEALGGETYAPSNTFTKEKMQSRTTAKMIKYVISLLNFLPGICSSQSTEPNRVEPCRPGHVMFLSKRVVVFVCLWVLPMASGAELSCTPAKLWWALGASHQGVSKMLAFEAPHPGRKSKRCDPTTFFATKRALLLQARVQSPIEYHGCNMMQYV